MYYYYYYWPEKMLVYDKVIRDDNGIQISTEEMFFIKKYQKEKSDEEFLDRNQT